MLGNKQLQASLKEANTHLESAQARIADLESDALTAQESLEEANVEVSNLKQANTENLEKLSEANASIEELETTLAAIKADFDTAVATGVENRLADAAPDIPVAAAAAAESVTADFEAAYEASRATGGASHAKFLNDNAEQIREYVEAQQG